MMFCLVLPIVSILIRFLNRLNFNFAWGWADFVIIFNRDGIILFFDKLFHFELQVIKQHEFNEEDDNVDRKVNVLM